MSYPQIPDSKFANFTRDLANGINETRVAVGAETTRALAAEAAIGGGGGAQTAVTLTESGTLDGSATLVLVASSDIVDVTLPDAAASVGKTFTIIRVDSAEASVSVRPAGADLINGNSFVSLDQQYRYVLVVSTGSEWVIIGQNTA